MVAAASREALRQKLDGIAFEVQGTDFSEIVYDTGASALTKRWIEIVLIPWRFHAVLSKALRSTH